MLALMSIYYWTIHRPDLLPPSAGFAAGIFHDFVAGLPVGVTAVVFLSVHAVLVSQRRFFVGKTFLVLWLGFVLVAMVAAVESWLLICFYELTLVDPLAPSYQFLMTVGGFPFVAWLLMRWHGAFLREV